MFTYEKIEDCPGDDSVDYSHYRINFENGNTIVLCLSTRSQVLTSSYENDIRSTVKNIANEAKQIELCYILDNIFNITYVSYDSCKTARPAIKLNDNCLIIYNNLKYSYYMLSSNSTAKDIDFTNIHDLLDFLREKYQHLLKPVKIALKYKEMNLL